MRLRSRLLAPWFALTVVVVASLGVLVARSDRDDSAQARAARLARELACPVCQGESVAESNADESRAIRADVADRIADGQSDAEILATYVDRYGERIRLRPEGEGLGLVAWAVPAVVIAIAAALLVLAVRRWSREPTQQAGTRARVLTALVVGGIGLFVLFLVVFLVGGTEDRKPGQTLTGNDAAGPTAEERAASLRAAVEEAPDDYDARIAYARILLASNPQEAVVQYDEAARIDPKQPEPLVYGGWIRGLVAQQVDDEADRQLLVDGALERFDEAIALDEDYEDAYVFKGLVLLNVMHDAAAAVPNFQIFLALAPPDHPQRELVQGALKRAIEASEAGAPTSTSSDTTTSVP